MDTLVRGIVAGAVGTTALNTAGYVDMLVRGRPASKVPARVAGALAERVGLRALAPNTIEGGAPAAVQDNERAEARRQALGSLLGIAVGVKLGAYYALLRPIMEPLPLVVRSLLMGASAMAVSDMLATSLGATNPRDWSAMDWLADIVPHAIYGVATVATYEHLCAKSSGSAELLRVLDQVLPKARLKSSGPAELLRVLDQALPKARLR
jgi:hypothetical protein